MREGGTPAVLATILSSPTKWCLLAEVDFRHTNYSISHLFIFLGGSLTNILFFF